MERGEVYFLRYDDGFGHEQAVGRPVVVISSNVGIDRCDVVTVAHLTSKYKQININVEVNCTPRRSWVLCNQINTVDKRRLGDKMCKLSPDELEEVDEKLCDALGLWGVIKEVEVEKIVEVEVGKPDVVDAEKTRLQIELDLYKKLYADLTTQIVDARFERQVVVENTPIVRDEIVATVVEEEVPTVEPEILVDTETLKKQMVTPNDEMVEDEPKKKASVKKAAKKETKKLGRPIKSGKYCRPTVEDLVEYKKSGKVNVNTDDWKTIAATTGMSVQTAQSIVAYRNKNGEFIDLTDLLFVPRFGSRNMSKYGQMLEV